MRAPRNGDRARVRATIDRLVRDGTMRAERDGAVHDVRAVAISPDEGDALTRWVRDEKPARTIEVGLGYGLSALCICDGLIGAGRPGARHLALDPFQSDRFADGGLEVLREAGVAHLVEHRAEISQTALPALWRAGSRFDFAFVDGNHRFDAVFLDLFYLGRLLPKGGVVFLDDYDLPGIRRAVSFWVENLGWTIEETAKPGDAHRWVVVRTATGDDRRDFRHFVEF